MASILQLDVLFFMNGREMSTPTKRVNSPFSDDEAVWTVLEYGALELASGAPKVWYTLSEEEQRSV